MFLCFSTDLHSLNCCFRGKFQHILLVFTVYIPIYLCQRPGKIGCRLYNRCSARRENSSHDFSVGKYFVNLGSPHLTPGLFNTLGEKRKMFQFLMKNLSDRSLTILVISFLFNVLVHLVYSV